MGTDFNVNPAGTAVAASIVRPQPDVVKAAVHTELPAPKTITPPDTSGATRNDQQSNNDNWSNQIVIDRAAAEIVYRVVDNRTSLVVKQYPDEARLRSRAYLRSLDEAKEEEKIWAAVDQRA
jgi:hypothetical protein